jgi:hypothetical protein
MPENTDIVVLELKDVLEFDLIRNIFNSSGDPNPNYIYLPYSLEFFGYKHMLVCELKLTFLVPTKDYVPE